MMMATVHCGKHLNAEYIYCDSVCLPVLFCVS